MSFNRIRIWTEQETVTIPNLFFQTYKELGLQDEEALLVLHLLAFQAEGNEFPTPTLVEQRTGHTQNQVSALYQRLMQKGLLEMKQDTNENGMLYEKFSLYPLWERILDKLEQRANVQSEHVMKLDGSAIFTLLEQELGRLLSPMEIETVSMWLDQDNHSPEIIKEAIKEAVLAGKTSLRYIDRILFEWKKKKITSIAQVQQHTDQFRQKTIAPQPQKPAADQTSKPNTGFYNWLDERE